MNIKKIILIALVLFLSTSLLTAAYTKKKAPLRSTLSFEKGDLFVTPQIGINSYAIPFGANFEYAMTENIGVGGTVMIWLWSDGGYKSSIILPSVDAAYHFTMLELDKIDLFAGVGLGFSIYSSDFGTGSSGIYISPFVAGRYWFSEKIGVSLRLNIGLIGDWSGVGGLFGVVFKL
jgi:hypothetical protein